MIKRMCTCCLMLFFAINLAGQNNPFDTIDNYPKEKIYLHTNTNFLLTGEALHYKIYCLDKDSNKMSSLSKVGYVELINKENKSISKQKIRLKQGTGSGQFFLASSLKTGTYKLISYTQWMRNKQVFFEENIFIVNPFSGKLNATNALKKDKFKETPDKTTNFLKLSLNKKEYQKREKVTLNFDANILANVSISVRKFDSISIPNKINSLEFIQNFKSSNILSKKIYLPELRGSLYKGIINSNKDIFNKKIGLSFVGETKITKVSVTNSKGVFYFNIDQPFSAEEVIIEVLEKNKEDYKISIIPIDELEKEFKAFNELLLTENIRKLVKQRSLHTQIENAFSEVKPSRYKLSEKKNPIFHQNQNKKIIFLDDYTRFKTMKEVSVEILQDVWISEEKENYAFNLRYVNLEPNKKTATLLIVDGYLIQNHNDFIFYDALKIKSIELIKAKYSFGAKDYQGIINIETFNSVFKPFINSTNRFLLPKPFVEKTNFKPNYNHHKKHHIPDFRSQLFWGSDFNKTSDIVSFYTSDLTGIFEVIIEGFTKDGMPIYEKIFFNVK